VPLAGSGKEGKSGAAENPSTIYVVEEFWPVRYIIDSNQLFLHIPKTAGCSIENIIDAKWSKGGIWRLRHRWDGLPGRHVRRQDLAEFKWEARAEAFCIVRHPIQWYASCWCHLQQMKKKRQHRGSDLAGMFRWFRWHPQIWLGQILLDDFGAWINKIKADRPGFLSDLYEQYIGLDQPTPYVQYVGRLETLGDDMEQLLGVAKPPRKNRTRWAKPKISTHAAEGIMEMEAKTIQRYYGPESIGFRHIEDWVA